MVIKAADMLIARRADTRARADFATWKMMAKLNGVSTLPAEARRFLLRYNNFLTSMSEIDCATMSDEVMRRVERELDLEEDRLEV